MGWGVIREHGGLVVFIIPLSEAMCFPIKSTEIVTAIGTHHFYCCVQHCVDVHSTLNVEG